MISGIPSVAGSVQTALESGFATLNSAAGEVLQGTQGGWPAAASNTTDLRAGTAGINGTEDPLLAGVRDLMMAKLQVGAGAALLHAYRENRQDLFDMLNDHDGDPS